MRYRGHFMVVVGAGGEEYMGSTVHKGTSWWAHKHTNALTASACTNRMKDPAIGRQSLK